MNQQQNRAGSRQGLFGDNRITVKHIKGSNFWLHIDLLDVLFQKPSTIMQISEYTGLPYFIVYRYVRWKLKIGYIRLVRRGICPVNFQKAAYYTTDMETWRAGDE